MKKNIHPASSALSVKCSCGNAFETVSTLKQSTLHIERCLKCHPGITGVYNRDLDKGDELSARQRLFKVRDFNLSQLVSEEPSQQG
jgi:large subunit ribosomal protein L31